MILTSGILLLLIGLAGIAYVAWPARNRRRVALAVTLGGVLLAAFVLAAAGATSVSPVEFWVLASGAILASTFGGVPVVSACIRLVASMPKVGGHEEHSELPATHWVGVFERFAFTFALLIARPEVAALVVAVKALGQYSTVPGSSNDGAAIRVVGTLASLGWAMVAYTCFLLATT